MKYGKKLIGLLVLGMLFVFLVATEDSCGEAEKLVPTSTIEEAAPTPEVQELTSLEAELAYLVAGVDLHSRSADIMGRLGTWSEDTADLYGQGVMFPSTDTAEEALIEAKAITEQIKVLSPPPGYEDSHSLWLTAQEKLEIGIALVISGVDESNPDLIVEGTATVAEATRLLELSTSALPE